MKNDLTASIADIFDCSKVFFNEQLKDKLPCSSHKLYRFGKTSLQISLSKPEIRDNIDCAPALVITTGSMASYNTGHNMSISDEGFAYEGASLPIQIYRYSNRKEEIPIIVNSDFYNNLVSIDDIDEWIEALEQYKELFEQKDIEKYSLVLRGRGSTAIEQYPDYEGLIDCRKKQTIGYVYLIHAVDLELFKIGYSKKPMHRLQQFSKQQIPSRLSMVCTIATTCMVSLEKELHHEYKHQRRHGEWFQLTEDEVEEIIQLSKDSSHA